MRLWRVSNHATLDGVGGELASGRWHTRRPGARIVYCADSPATCLLELLVHLEVPLDGLPVHYRLLEIEAPDELRTDRVEPDSLPAGWRDDHHVTQALGDAWLAARSSALLAVPSALVPATWNLLLAPDHPDASAVRVVAEHRDLLDRRLLR